MRGGQRESAGGDSGGVEEGGGHCGWADGVGGFGTSAEAFVVAGDLHDLDVGGFLHGENFVAAPTGAGHFAFVEGDFFLEGFAEAHDDAAFHATVELARVDDLTGV